MLNNKILQVGDSTDCFEGAIIHIPIKSHFAGSYKLEYDGKYITLLGKDKNYPCMWIKGDYEEMVLIGCVLEVRNAKPIIKDITEKEIIINLGCV